MRIRVMLVDDHALMREGIKQLFKIDRCMDVVSEANDGEECLEKLAECKPDILLLDINMPKKNGIEVLKEIRERNISVKVLILTMYSDIEFLRRAVAIGVNGYLTKNVEFAELKHAIFMVLQGENYVQSSLISSLKNIPNSQNNDKEKFDDNKKDDEKNRTYYLTKREVEVLIKVSNGLSNKEIATSLNITERTVKNHISSIFRKIRVSDRTQAALFAIKNNVMTFIENDK